MPNSTGNPGKVGGPYVYSKSRYLYVFAEPHSSSVLGNSHKGGRWIGYLGLGGFAKLRDPNPIIRPRAKCPAFYAVEPRGYVCVDGEHATLNPEDPVYVALTKLAPHYDRPVPFSYGESKGARIRATIEGDNVPTWPSGIQERRNELPRRSTLAWTDELTIDGTTWLRASDMSIVRKDRVIPYSPSEFAGTPLAGKHLPLAFFRAHDRPKYRLRENANSPIFEETGDHWKRLTHIELTGKVQSEGPRRFRETTDGLWVLERDAVIIEPQLNQTPWGTKLAAPHAPSTTPSTHTWIEIHAIAGWLLAYEDDAPVFATLISAGKLGAVDFRPNADQPPATTPLGTFQVRTKYQTVNLRSDLADGVEFIHSEVPFSLHFIDKYLLHTAYWHDKWGEGKSGGCVNLSPKDAKWLFDWSEPKLPEGWHAYRPQADEAATRIIILR